MAASFSSYLGGSSDERCGVCEISEDEGAPEIVYMDTCSLSEAEPWPSGAGVLLKREREHEGRRGKECHALRRSLFSNL